MPSWLHHNSPVRAAAGLNLIYGQAGGRAEVELLQVPHDIDQVQFEALPLSPDLRLAADHFLPGDPANVPIPSLHHLGPIVRVGPRQHMLLERMVAAGAMIGVLGGFRSVHFQALLYASRFLDGTLFDADGRAYVALPGQSEHQVPDRAIDVEDPIAFAIAALQFRSEVNLEQPFLFDPRMASEPWHFRTEFIDERQDAVEIAGGFLDQITAGCRSFFLQDGSVTPNSEFIFVSGRSTSGAYKCIGSKQASVADSLADALGAVGEGWAYYVISFIRGFTPIMDNQVLAHEIGRLAYRMLNDDGVEGYLLPSSCSFERLLTRDAVIGALQAKTGIAADSTYFLDKAQVVDFLYMPGVTLQLWRPQPRSFGSPLSIGEALGRDALGWFKSNWQLPFPPYLWNAYFGALRETGDLTRCAFVLDAISAARPWRDPEIEEIVRDGIRRLARIVDGPSPSYRNDTPDETVVHLLRAATRESMGDELSHLRSSIGPMSERRALRFLQGDGPEVDIISTGSIADLLAQEGHATKLRILSEAAAAGGRDRAIEAVQRDLALALGCAQLLCAIRDEQTARRLADYIVLQPPHPSPESFGAFAGYGDFRSLLTTEALVRISLAFPRIFASPAVAAAIEAGLKFARTLQFKASVGVVHQQPTSARGAITHSPCDHNFYIDYTGHALQLAALTTELFG